MDTFQHKGTTYVKASILAKRHRYTTDYIGQLCRGNKVDAQLVGRAWYVNEISLLSHKIVHKKVSRPNEILSRNSTEFAVDDVSTVKVPVHSTLSKKTHRQFFSEELRPTAQHNWQNRTVAYVGDSSTLVPQVTSKIIKTLVESPVAEKSVFIPVDLAHSSKVVVKDVSHHNHRQHLAFTELPEIPLEGVLPISSLDSVAEYAEPEPIRPDDMPQLHPVVPVVASKIARYQKPVRSSGVNTLARDTVESTLLLRSEMPTSREVSRSLTTDIPARAHFEKRAVAEKAVSKQVPYILPLVFAFSFLLASLSLALSSTTVYENGAVQRSFSFHAAYLGEALLYLTQQP